MPEPLWVYLMALLYFTRASTCLTITEAMSGTSHDRLTRMLHGNWSGQTLLNAALRTLFTVAGGYLIVDDTAVEKPYAQRLGEAAWVWSSKHSQVVFFERMLNINVRAAFWLARAVFPYMKQQHYGRIVFTTSGRAMYLESALPGLTCYTMGKLAQVGLMQSLAAEGAAWNIRVNAVAPVAATRMLRRQVEPGTFRPEHVAPGVAFLASAQCEQSGIILQMGNRHFSTARYARGQEITLAPDALTPEAIADRWQALLAPPA